MVIGLLTVELFIGDSHTLKDKRRVIKSIIDRLRAKFNISVAETGYQDVWQRAELGVAALSNDAGHISQILNKVARFIEVNGEVEVINFQMEIL